MFLKEEKPLRFPLDVNGGVQVPVEMGSATPAVIFADAQILNDFVPVPAKTAELGTREFLADAD